MQFERIDIGNKKLSFIEQFLAHNDLTLDKQILSFVAAYDDDNNLVGCAGIAPGIIKCVAIDESCRGEGLALQLATEVIHLAYDLGYPNLFIFTKPEYEILFQQCGFTTISTAYPHVVLLENSKTRLKKQCEKWAAQRVAGNKIGAIVMNANPFTLGHRYLAEQAAGQCDHVHIFVVEEDASQFSYADRMMLVKQGVADLANVTVHSSSPYIISKATFPSYFLKDATVIEQSYLEIDLRLFRQHIAPALGITHRFIGTEPQSAVTAAYNRSMHYWLQQAQMDSPEVAVVEIERKCYEHEVISASTVRSLLKTRNWAQLAHFVPESTLAFLKDKANHG